MNGANQIGQVHTNPHAEKCICCRSDQQNQTKHNEWLNRLKERLKQTFMEAFANG